MNALHSSNCTWFSVGHAVFQSISAEVLQNKDITCVFLLKWSDLFGLRRCAVAKTVFTAISCERYIVRFQTQKHLVTKKLKY